MSRPARAPNPQSTAPRPADAAGAVIPRPRCIPSNAHSPCPARRRRRRSAPAPVPGPRARPAAPVTAPPPEGQRRKAAAAPRNRPAGDPGSPLIRIFAIASEYRAPQHRTPQKKPPVASQQPTAPFFPLHPSSFCPPRAPGPRKTAPIPDAARETMAPASQRGRTDKLSTPTEK